MNERTGGAIGSPVDNNIDKNVIIGRLIKIRGLILEIEDIYYSFRDDVESSLQDVKYQLDKLSKNIGENEDVVT